MEKEGYVTINIQGTLNDLEPLINRLKEMAIRQMNEVKTMEEAKGVWNKYQYFQKHKEFIEAKEVAKDRIKNQKVD